MASEIIGVAILFSKAAITISVAAGAVCFICSVILASKIIG
jgi:hypothetical protein